MISTTDPAGAPEASAAIPPPRLLGGYLWTAYDADGTATHQFTPDGAEQSVDVLRGRPVRALELVPRPGLPHPRVVLDVPPGADWIKHWARAITVDMTTGAAIREECVDVIGLHVGDVQVRLLIYPDGSILVTSDPER